MSNTPTTDQPTVVRMKETRAHYHLFAGQTYPHEGYDPENGWPILRIPMGLELAIDPDQCEVIEVTLTADLHVIVETGGTAPDLADIFRLITYLRENEVWADVGQNGLSNGVKIGWIDADGRRRIIAEFVEHPKAFYVGPDGTVYDCNGEAL